MLDLQKQAVTLRFRWEWLRRIDLSKPWQGLPMVSDPMNLNRWVTDIAGGLSTAGLVQYVHLWEAVVVVQFRHNSDNEAIWNWSRALIYTPSSTYRRLSEGALRISCTKAPWKSWAPLN